MNPAKPSAAQRLQTLRKAFIAQLPAQLGTIKEIFNSIWPGHPPEGQLEKFHRSLHSLGGSSAAFGLDSLRAAAAKGEHLAKKLLAGDIDLASPWGDEMLALLDAIEQTLLTVNSAQNSDPFILDIATAQAGGGIKGNTVVYLCEDDPFQLASLTKQISCFGFDVSAFQKLEDFQTAVTASPPDVIVMDMIHPDSRTGGAQVVKTIRDKGDVHIPVVFISTASDMGSRLAAVRAGCDAYFVKPVNPTELGSTLHTLSAPEQPDPYRILIIDDDPNLTGVYSAILTEAGMLTQTLNDPMQALPCLEEFKPDLVLMDMHMPGCNGLELAAVIRQIEAYISLPIIFLSIETDENLQIDAKRFGGDEFLHKTIKPQHLVSTVAVRAQRMKLLRSFMVRDSLTGLFNHSTIKEHLEIAVQRASRANEELCFAMIDLDHFKQVNDRHGHPAGDRVLLVMANLLKQRLRKSDVVGRYGGEEFAIILPGISLPEAMALMELLRESFENIRFPIEDDFFSLTFSCGVASQKSHAIAEKLCMAADQAMYAAKKEGRNRVMAAERLTPPKA